jgi:hypothetical protein
MKRIASVCTHSERIVTPGLGAGQRRQHVPGRRAKGAIQRSTVLPFMVAGVVALSSVGCASPERDGLTAPSAVAAASAEQRARLENAPFKGGDSGTFEFLQTGCAAGSTPLKTQTTGTATLIGTHSFETEECFDNNAFTFSGSFTIAAANGDTLVGTLVGTGIGVQEDGTATYTFTATITTGTGRFAGATGTFSGSGGGNLNTFDESRTFSGTITVRASTSG